MSTACAPPIGFLSNKTRENTFVLDHCVYVMSNDLVLGEAGLRQVTYIIHERLYGHVARLPAEDPANLILQYRDPSGWTIPRGRPHASFGGLSDRYGHVGLASAWVMARRRPI